MADHEHDVVARLARIENGIKALLDRVYFPFHNAHDGKTGQALTDALKQEKEWRDAFVKSLLHGNTIP